MPMLVNLHTQDRLIKFEKQSSMKSINITHVLNQINYPNPFLFLIYFSLSFLFMASPIYVKSKNWTNYQNHCYVKRIGIDHLCRSSAHSTLLLFCPSCGPSLRKFRFQLKFDWRFLASPSLHATDPLLILFPY